MKKLIGFIAHGDKMHNIYLDSDSVFVLDKVYPANQFAYALRSCLYGNTLMLSGTKFKAAAGMVRLNWAYMSERGAELLLGELTKAGYTPHELGGIS